MKKGLCLVAILVLLFSAACTAKVEPAPTLSFNTAPVTTPSTHSAPVTPERTQPQITTNGSSNSDIRYAELLPDPKSVFMNGDISITDGDGGKAYIFEVTGYADGEYESYISECQEMGFKDVIYETNEKRSSDFGAYTNNGEYWVEVSLDKEYDVIYVICQESKKK